jgi:tRNA-dihydrouridine synthase A
LNAADHRFCVAPMMDLTDRHARFFLRLLSRRARLYTEMITTGALLHGDAPRFLRFDPAEHPLAIQLGGSEPRELARCARMAQDSGYDEVNLNVGCPSDRVQSGRFGACLMAEPALVADCMAAMIAAVRVPVTLKTRIGIDRDESTERLWRLVEAVHAAGVRVLVVHARNAWLDGLSPKENREVPPLRYEVVHALKAAFPDCTVVVNGGITTLAQCRDQLAHADGVMLGREAYYNPWLLQSVDPVLFGEAPPLGNLEDVVERLLPYAEREHAGGTPLSAITRHVLGLVQGVPGARQWRRTLSEQVHRPGATPALLREALDAVRNASAGRAAA